MAQLLVLERPFDPAFVSELGALVRSIFGELDDPTAQLGVTDVFLADLEWRLAEMPAASVHAGISDGQLIGFKFGYAIGKTRYLSWLGGVASSHRRQGIARALLQRQHAWAAQRGFGMIETGTTSTNAAMLTLNLAAGFEVIGSYARDATPRVVLQKRLLPPGIA